MDYISKKVAIEETEEFLPDFYKINSINGVIPVAVQNIETNEVILIAYTNQKAFAESLKTGLATFWSTSRNELWVKGATSGQYFNLVEVYVNCEQNSLVYKVKPRKGGICHTKNKAGKPRNCFYRRLDPETMKLENINP
jgi:phosphoribosyl-AMP cyclohydrolase